MGKVIKQNEIVDLLNSTGIPFQDWIAYTIGKNKNYHYQVEVPYTSLQSGTIDIVAVWFKGELPSSPFDGSIFLIIEAKKANPQIKNWIFIKDMHTQYHKYYASSFISITDKAPHIERALTFPDLNYLTQEYYDKCINAFEYNHQLKLNRNTEEKIYRSLLQVHEGLNGFAQKDPVLQRITFNFANETIYIPVVVTTANLFTAEYDPEKVELPEGILDPDKTDIKEVQWLTYEFPITRELSIVRSLDVRTCTEKLTTFIVAGKHWAEFLKKVFVIYGKGQVVDKYLLK